MGGRWIVRGGAILVVLGVAAGTWGVARGLPPAVDDDFLLTERLPRFRGAPLLRRKALA